MTVTFPPSPPPRLSKTGSAWARGRRPTSRHLPLHLPGETLVLRLVLHTWQADQIINRARTGATILLTLTAGAWVLGFLLVRLLKRDARRREQMARQEQMARLGELGAVLAHEVRTPLAGIKGYAQLLGERITDERSRRFAALIAQEAVRLEGLVNDLLDYARQDDPGDGCTLLDEELLHDAWNMVIGPCGWSAGKTGAVDTARGAGRLPPGETAATVDQSVQQRLAGDPVGRDGPGYRSRRGGRWSR